MKRQIQCSSFTEDDYNIFAFDDEGNMVVQINTWSWSHEFTEGLDDILRQEESYDYNFQDADWNNFASARKSQEFISDTTESGNPDKTDILDREHTGGVFVFAKMMSLLKNGQHLTRMTKRVRSFGMT